MVQKILVANDGSKGGEAAVRAAIALANQLGVGLSMVCVEYLERFPATVDRVAEAQTEAADAFDATVDRAKAEAKAAGVALEARVIVGHPVKSIVEEVSRGGYDLLVVGYMGHSALFDRMIGSTTNRLVELSPCPVMVVK